MNLEDAWYLARKVHKGQLDKAGKPYIEHIWRVFRVLEGDGGTLEEYLICAVLHDVFEDGFCLENCLFELTETQYNILDSLTRRKTESYFEYIKRCSMNIRATAIKVIDIDDNLTPNRWPEMPDSLKNRYEKALTILTGV